MNETGLVMPLLDLIIIATYIILVLALGLFSVRKTKLSSQQYFLAGKSLPWAMVGAGLFSANISTIHLIAGCLRV